MIFCVVIPAHHRPHIRTAVLRARGIVSIPQEVRDRLDQAVAGGERGTVFGGSEEFLAFLDASMKPSS
jgi:hypothetical protein